MQRRSDTSGAINEWKRKRTTAVDYHPNATSNFPCRRTAAGGGRRRTCDENARCIYQQQDLRTPAFTIMCTFPSPALRSYKDKGTQVLCREPPVHYPCEASHTNTSHANTQAHETGSDKRETTRAKQSGQHEGTCYTRLKIKHRRRENDKALSSRIQGSQAKLRTPAGKIDYENKPTTGGITQRHNNEKARGSLKVSKMPFCNLTLSSKLWCSARDHIDIMRGTRQAERQANPWHRAVQITPMFADASSCKRTRSYR